VNGLATSRRAKRVNLLKNPAGQNN